MSFINKMRIILTEKQLRKLVEDISYPSQFNLEYFRNIKTFSDRIKYCNMYLQQIAYGSSRIVYKSTKSGVVLLSSINLSL